MVKQTKEQWNLRVSELKVFINQTFPSGCEGIECIDCIFGPTFNSVCEIMWETMDEMSVKKLLR